MKALIKDAAGVHIGTVPKPKLSSEREVLVRVAMTGLCRIDHYVAMGFMGPVPDPLILGHECSGIVEETGAAVKRVAPGERVAVMPLIPSPGAAERHPYSRYQMLGLHRNGSLCDYVALPDIAVHRIPPGMSFKQAAYMEPVTASLAVLNAGMTPRETGLLYGDNRISRLTQRILERHGFGRVDVYDPHAKDREPLTEDAFDFIIETVVNAESVRDIVRALRPGGRFVLKSRQWEPVSFPVHDLVRKDIRMTAVHYGDFAEGIRLVADGELQVDDLFGDVRPLEDFRRAFEESEHAEAKKLFLSTANEDIWNR